MIKNFIILGLMLILGLVVLKNFAPHFQFSSITSPAQEGQTVVPGVPDVSILDHARTVVEKANGVTLNLSNKSLSKVPSMVFERTELTTLNLSNNKLSGSLPGEIRLLSNLETLNLSNNNFTGVPAEIGQLSHLRVLDLSSNPITGLPNELGNLQKLERLDLSGTKYSPQDLAGIKAKLPTTTVIVTN